MKSLVLTLILTFLSINIAIADENCGIKFEKTNVCANIEWIYGPYLDQYNSAKISLTNIENFTSIKVIPWMVMSSHEHGSRPVTLTKTSDNEYLIEKAYFMGGMQGTWFFKVQLLKDTTVLEEVRTAIQFK